MNADELDKQKQQIEARRATLSQRMIEQIAISKTRTIMSAIEAKTESMKKQIEKAKMIEDATDPCGFVPVGHSGSISKSPSPSLKSEE
jgi:hypothetical protein